MSLAELLNAHTGENGNWSISCNEHKGFYETPECYFINSRNDADELVDVNLSENIYCLYWYILAPSGFLIFYGNSIEQIEEKVKKYLEEERKVLRT